MEKNKIIKELASLMTYEEVLEEQMEIQKKRLLDCQERIEKLQLELFESEN